MSKITKVRAYLAAVLAATFSVDEIRFMASAGLISGSTFQNGELTRGYLPMREYGQKLTRALMSRFPLADNMDCIMELLNNGRAAVTTVHSQGTIGKDGILDTVVDSAFTAIDEIFQGLAFLGLGKNIEKVVTGKDGQIIKSADISSAGSEITDILPWMSTPFSFMEDTMKFGKLVNIDGTSQDPFYTTS